MALDRNRFKPTGSAMDVARTWPEKEKPLKEGDSIEGEYLQKLTDIGVNKSNVYVLDVNGERVGVWGSTVIDARMADVQIGMTVGFEFLGMEQGKQGKYKNFMVAIDEQGEIQVGDVQEDDDDDNPLK